MQNWVFMGLSPFYIYPQFQKGRRQKKTLRYPDKISPQKSQVHGRALASFGLEVRRGSLSDLTGRVGGAPGLCVPRFPHLSNESIGPEVPAVLSWVPFCILLPFSHL